MNASNTGPENRKSFTSFLTVWLGQLVSGLGSGMSAFGLGVYIFRKTGSATYFAMIILCSFLPSILLKPVGGVLADRLDRRVLIAAGDFGSGAGILFILITLLGGDLQPWAIYTGVSVSSIFNALQSPAYKAAVTDLLTEEQFAQAGGLVQLASSAQHLISPFAAGLLLTVTNLETILMIDISTFLLSVLAVMMIGKSLRPERENSFQGLSAELKEGLETLTCKKGILHLVTILACVTFTVGFLQTLLGPMVLSFTTADVLGTAQSLSAVGMLAGGIYIGIRKSNTKQSSVLSVSLILSGIFYALIGLRPDIRLITAAGFLFFCTLPFINTSADVLIRKNIPNESQGRAWAIIGVISQSGYLAAYAVSGFLADRVFNPLLDKGGILVSYAGPVIGSGPGRGIGLLILIAGILTSIFGVISSMNDPIRTLEKTR